MRRFEKGDRVECVKASDYYHAGQPGEMFEVTWVSPPDHDQEQVLNLKALGPHLYGDRDLHGCMSSRFRHADAPAITPLDDAGRAALKAGDRVLVEATVVENRADDDGDRKVRGEYTGGYWTEDHKASAIYALLPPAPKPIAAGDRVRILGGQVGKAIGQASDGTWAVEYDAGDNINISRYDASALEVVS